MIKPFSNSFSSLKTLADDMKSKSQTVAITEELPQEPQWRLVDEDNNEVKIGATIKNRHGKPYVLVRATPPFHINSSGRIYVRDARLPEGEYCHEFFPHVLSLKWIQVYD